MRRRNNRAGETAVTALLSRLGFRGRGASKPLPLRYEPGDLTLVRDPYPFYRHLRHHDPVHLTATGALLVTRYVDVVEGLGHSLLGNAPARYAAVAPRHRSRHVSADLANNILPFMDKPGHEPLRRVIARSFHAHQKATPLHLEAIAAHHAAALAHRTEFDVLADFATPFSVHVVCSLLGIPLGHERRLKGFSEYFFFLFSQIPSQAVREEMDRRLAEFRDYTAELVVSRRVAPGSDYVSALIVAADAAGIDDDLVRDAVILIFADAVENVDRAIASCLYLLLSHPDQLHRLQQEPALLSSAIEECLRFESPAQVIARIAMEPFIFAGVPVRADQAVFLALGSANRDERRFAEADRLDIGRRDNVHLTFGKGSHSCIGGSLVHKQIHAALTALLGMGELSLADAEPTWVARPGHRWLAKLPVRACRKSA